MCERAFYKYKVLMMVVKQSKEGREDEAAGGRKKGWSHSAAEKRCRLGIPASSIFPLQSNGLFAAHQWDTHNHSGKKLPRTRMIDGDADGPQPLGSLCKVPNLPKCS